MVSEISREDVKMSLLLVCPLCEDVVKIKEFEMYADTEAHSQAVIELRCPACHGEVCIKE